MAKTRGIPETLSSPFRRNIAFVDGETTGLDPDIHELIQLGIVVVEQPNLNIMSQHEFKIRPDHIATATSEALAVNGYTSAAWQDALTLREAMELYRGIVGDAILCMHKVDFDSSFLKRALKKPIWSKTVKMR